MKYGLFLFLLFAQSAFALYGVKVEKASEPFVVSLHLRDAEHANVDSFCNGVLIAPDKVLTAGHCIDVMGLDLYEMSHALIYRPHLLKVKIGNTLIRAKAVTFSPSYFEGVGFEAEDLAVIELEKTTYVRPVALASKNSLMKEKRLTLIAGGRKTSAFKSTVRFLRTSGVVIIADSAGACLGDSGGAVLINENGQQKLAGILMYDGEGMCERKSGYAFIPKARI